MPLQLDRKTLDSGIEVIHLSGSLTLGRDSQALEWLVESLGNPGPARIVLDMTGVPFVDSAGIGILVGSHGKTASAGGQLRIAGATDRVRQVFGVTKVDSILRLDPSVADSLKALAESA